MKTFRPLAAAALTAALLPAAAATAHAATTLDPALAAPTTVAAYDGTAMWSVQDAATGQFKLVKSVDGAAPVDVAVPERATAFDVDLGTNRSGSLTAVYTRDGSVYRLDVASGAERKLSSLGGGASKPSVQRGQIAFISRAGSRDVIRVGNTTSGAGAPRAIVSAPSIDSVELGIKQIAYVTSDKGHGFGGQKVHVRNVSTGRDQVVFRSTSGGASFSVVTKPSFTEDLKSFVFDRSVTGTSEGNRIVKYTLRTGKLTYARNLPRVASTAYVSPSLGIVASTALDPAANDGCTDAGTNYCSVQMSGPLAFSAAAK